MWIGCRESGAKVKIEVSGLKARLYLNDSPQPVLVVNDLKHGHSQGAVALWIGMGTEAYFANLRWLEQPRAEAPKISKH